MTTRQDTLEYHICLLSDSTRTQRFREAIQEIVRPGDVVADVGCGTGILGRFALEAGASRVYMIDNDEHLLRLALGLTALFHPDADVIAISEDVRYVRLPEKVDLVLAELIGVFPDDEDFSVVVPTFCRTNLKKTGRVCPAKITAYASRCAVDIEKHFGSPDKFRYIPTSWERVELVGRRQRMQTIDAINGADRNSWRFKHRPRGNGSDRISGLAVWFRAQLSESVVLSNGPNDPPTSWGVFVAVCSRAGMYKLELKRTPPNCVIGRIRKVRPRISKGHKLSPTSGET